MNLRDVQRQFREIPIALILEPVLPSRTAMDEEKLEELALSIRRDGLLQPIIVAPVGDNYEVIAGHRRRLASARAGLVAMPCIVYPTKEAALEGVKYAENRFREELNAADEAMYFSELLERDCGGDVDRLCEVLGEKRGYVEGRLALFQGDPEVFRALQDGKIKIGVAHQLNRVTAEPTRRMYLEQAIRGGATVAVVAGWVADFQRFYVPSDPSSESSEPAPTPGAIPQSNFFTCAVCQESKDVHLMIPINVHSYCKQAILDRLLATYRGE